MKLGEHWKLAKELFGHNIWFKCWTFCHNFLWLVGLGFCFVCLCVVFFFFFFWSEVCGDSEKKEKLCTYQEYQNYNMSSLCLLYINLMLHGFWHNLCFWDNVIHISWWINPSLSADQCSQNLLLMLNVHVKYYHKRYQAASVCPKESWRY